MHLNKIISLFIEFLLLCRHFFSQKSAKKEDLLLKTPSFLPQGKGFKSESRKKFQKKEAITIERMRGKQSLYCDCCTCTSQEESAL